MATSYDDDWLYPSGKHHNYGDYNNKSHNNYSNKSNNYSYSNKSNNYSNNSHKSI